MSSQPKSTVGFLGPIASYTHQAVRQTFPQSKWDFQPVTTIEDVFEVVQAGKVTAGVVPFENSTNGAVVFTLDDFADRRGHFKDIVVLGEIYVDVHHCLVGRMPPSAAGKGAINGDGSGTCTPTADDPRPVQPRTKPLTDLSHIKRLYSHPQAFGQCATFISTYLKGAEIFEVSSTSKAAEIVSQDETGTGAAISSQLAAELQGLDFLGRSIEDKDDNRTRFLIIARGPDVTSGRPPSDWQLIQNCYEGDRGVSGGTSGCSKSLLSFTVSHDSPGALAEVLSCFKAFDLNLTSINSIPTQVRPFEYIFFVEFRGDRYDDAEGRVDGALERIAVAAQRSRFLGSWMRYG